MCGTLDRIGSLSKTYDIVKCIRVAENSELYKVWHTRLRKHYVIKVHKVQNNISPEVYKNQALTLKKIGSLWTPIIYDFVPNENKCYTIMEYIEGENIENLIRHCAVFTFQMIVQWYYQIATTLEELHKNNISHRDIKPSNLMVNKFGEVYLIDFDSASVGGESEGIVSRSKGYTSPEQQKMYSLCKCAYENNNEQSKVAEYRSYYNNINWKLADIYSLGATMYRIVTGNLLIPQLYDSNEFLLFDEQYINEEKIEKSRIYDIIKRSTNPEPNERFITARELKSAILEVMV